jgi:diaminopimelate decarboxylase
MDVFGSVNRVVRVGDLVAFERTGAYGLTESMLFFLSHPLPVEVGILGH